MFKLNSTFWTLKTVSFNTFGCCCCCSALDIDYCCCFGIVADKVADFDLFHDFYPGNLTTFGSFDDCFGTVLGKCFVNTVPHSYYYNPAVASSSLADFRIYCLYIPAGPGSSYSHADHATHTTDRDDCHTDFSCCHTDSGTLCYHCPYCYLDCRNHSVFGHNCPSTCLSAIFLVFPLDRFGNLD
jgi:hypothetical protein